MSVLKAYAIFSVTSSLAALALAWWAGRRGPLPEGSSVGLILFGGLVGAVVVFLAVLGGWL
ncbi:hypothetical protein KZX47_13575 [Thermus sp. SYSU G05001]|uniref:Uncharacterized protein n=1 Tax=Thermus brevis TaxID=2862456 RepID=A0ABS7A4A2_9DEIN|nr:hypothetical protein [Thermus brevis]MBW6396170.1 hypothetical protein [Thermus brevis]